MSPQKTCPECGTAITPNQLICPGCGTELQIEEDDLPSIPGLGSISSPELKIDFQTVSSLDLDSIAPDAILTPGLDTLDAGKLALSSLAGKTNLAGQPYKVLQVIGKVDEDQPELRMPFGIAPLPGGDFYLINYYNEDGCAQVQRFNPFGVLQAVVRQFTVEDGADAPGIPAGFCADVAGSFYIVDMDTCSVKKYAPDGALLAEFGEEGEALGQLSEPDDIAASQDGCIYIADAGNNRIQKWDAQGQPQQAIPLIQEDEVDQAPESTDEPGGFDGPQSIALDRQGNLWVADTNNHRLQQFDPEGKLLAVFGEEGKEAGQLYFPRRVRIDGTGNLYITDAVEDRFQKFDPSGRFIYQVALPRGSGKVEDLYIDGDERVWVVLRSSGLVLRLAIE
ncbi:MAG: hypothetical protein GX491_20720 [Chloroflexi bacterium]|nr:hypothetical protein [Chloroflexota bacterium]